MHGSSEDSTGCVLRGTVVLNLKKPLKVRSIGLRLKGAVNFKLASDLCRKKETIIKYKWSILKPSDHIYTLGCKSHLFDFEIPLGGDLPESVKTTHGSISYKLTAWVERPGFNHDIKTSIPIMIQRLLSPLSCSYQDPPTTSISGVWASRFFYEADIPNYLYSPGESIPVVFKFDSLDTFVQVEKVILDVVEYTVYKRAIENPFVQNTQYCNTIQEFAEPMGTSWSTSFKLPLPQTIQLDCETKYIEVNHILLARLFLSTAEGCTVESFQLHFPIMIRPNGETQTLTDVPPPDYSHFAPPIYDGANCAPTLAPMHQASQYEICSY
ncbi:hypothetical protein K493DRAFT_317765 [Basidiobolus meristosporus CBS 931.73]|uniref:Arrestin C-terminal-like domain-containing protein n=1 Tax=Basidiobolus meristosporus CBS 931.73 TaxID=1314790 RepID=A0A1Y1XY83_9FUNG|nr:hypothetical protein K493DRAFT_317765 [Basidiobolus meristosporus CBS 931.73]|eukprot:ORX90717.1 hypothetical protein K493DRAFT_317765 [Basidiobolus meristosporus CBS 931.73]